MATTTRRACAIAIPLFALQLTACSDSLLAPDPSNAGPQFLLGDSPLAPFSLAEAPVLETEQGEKGQIERQLVVEVNMTPTEADALEQGKRVPVLGGFLDRWQRDRAGGPTALTRRWPVRPEGRQQAGRDRVAAR